MNPNQTLRTLLCALGLFTSSGSCLAQAPATATPPPAAPAKRSAAELEKLVAPIALYPDALLATVLTAAVYPLEIVQAARFVANTNNLAKLDAQPWDDNVKAVARVPEAIKKLNDDLAWTMELGEAFLAQDKEIMDAIQAMRGKAKKAGTLQTTPQQVVTVTNTLTTNVMGSQVIYVTNTVVQIAPASSSVVYVPTYNPYTVYYPPPAYVYNPYAPLISFGVAVGIGAIIHNNCNWHHGGCYNNVNIDIDRNVDRNSNRNVNRNSNASGQQKWQPDQSRLNKTGASASTRSAEARGYGSGGARPSTGSVGARPSTGTGTAGVRPSTGTATTRPSTGTAAARPSTGTSTWQGNSPSAARPSSTTANTRPASSPSANRSPSGGSAFGGSNSGAGASAYSSRGSSSRGGGGGFSRGGGGGGGRR